MIVTVSDVHLGTAHLPEVTPPDRGQFKGFLCYLRDDLRPDHLVLNGDIDDLWRRNIRTLTRENYDIYNLLAELRDSGIKIHYILGNHDWYARQDRRGLVSRYNKPYYDTEYMKEHSLTIPEPTEELSLTTHKTNYKFKHGYQYDDLQNEWYFDKLAVISGDATGASFSNIYSMFSAVESTFPALRGTGRLIYDRMTKGPWEKRITKMDRHESDLDLGIAPGRSLDEVRQDSDTDWLCIGHTHHAGIKANPTGANGGVANSGAWIGGTDTYLILEESPRLMDWNDGNPTERNKQTISSYKRKLSDLLPQ